MNTSENETIYPSKTIISLRSHIREAKREKYQFASDNTAGLCPEALEALVKANAGSCAAYGDDEWTAEAAQLFRNVFECDCDVYFVFNGTAANSLALSSLCQSYHGVITHERAHIETDECGAPEFFSNGTKILLTSGENGKLDLEKVEHLITRRRDIHFPKPKVISITQPTELGTLYSAQELKEVGLFARRYGLCLHMDGARFAQAVAALGVPPRVISWEAGVDVLCFGGTKSGFGFSRQSSSSTASFPGNLTIGANRPVNWHRRCVSSPRLGFLCCGMGCGSSMRTGPTGAPGCSPAVWGKFGASESYTPARPTRSSLICQAPFILLYRIEAGIITASLVVGGRASCVPGRQRKRMWPNCCVIVRRFREQRKNYISGGNKNGKIFCGQHVFNRQYPAGQNQSDGPGA